MEENTNDQPTIGAKLRMLKMKLQGKYAAVSYQRWSARLYKTVFRRTLLENLSKWQTTTIWQRIMKNALKQPRLYAIVKNWNDRIEQRLLSKLILQRSEKVDFNK